MLRNLIQRGVNTAQMVGRGTRVAAEEFSSFLANPAHLHVFIILVFLHNSGPIFLTSRAAPLSFWSFIQLRIETAKMVSTGTGVAEDDLSSLLTYFTELLMFGLIICKVFLLFPFLPVLVSKLNLSFALLLFPCFCHNLHILRSHGIFSLSQHVFKLFIRVTFSFLLLFTVTSSFLLSSSQLYLELRYCLSFSFTLAFPSSLSFLLSTIITVIIFIIVIVILVFLFLSSSSSSTFLAPRT